MKSILWAFLAWTLLLCACSTRLASPQLPPPPIIDRPSALPPTAVPSSKDEISTVAPNPQDCGYQWANQDLSELSRSFQASIQALQPEAQANAYAFGENCVLADGSVRSFGAMETDFKVTLQVTD